MEFRERVVKDFDGLFGGDSDEQPNDFSESQQFTTRWGWYSSIYQLSKGDVTKFDRITNEGLFKCLTLLSFEKEKNEIEIRQIRRANAKLL